ncbi:MAG: hypothetical protein QXO30_01735 [Candidatus Caldarchaeum sp.]
MELSVYKIVLKLESPVALPTRRARLGYLGTPQHIPAATLRGSVLTALYREGLVNEDFLKHEASHPSIVASPAYPLVDGEESKPANPFIYQCKKCEGAPIFANESEAFYKILSSEEPEIPLECGRKHRALRQLHPSPIIRKGDGMVKEACVKGFRYVAVNISRRRASAVKGVLYSYEAVVEPERFWATISSLRELDLAGLQLLVGRGVSRGLGRVKVEKAQKIDLSKTVESFAKTVNEPIILYAMSPLLDGAGLEWRSFPKMIDLNGLASMFNINADGKLVLEKAYGRTTAFDAGWDMYNQNLRPRFEAKTPGTIVKASLKDTSGNVGLLMAILRYWGSIALYNTMPITGVNMLELVEV